MSIILCDVLFLEVLLTKLTTFVEKKVATKMSKQRQKRQKRKYHVSFGQPEIFQVRLIIIFT